MVRTGWHCTRRLRVKRKKRSSRTAKKAFLSAEADERIRRALQVHTPTSTFLVFQNGQSVYNKQADSPEWKGSGIVIEKENQTVLVKHGSVYVRVHPS